MLCTTAYCAACLPHNNSHVNSYYLFDPPFVIFLYFTSFCILLFTLLNTCNINNPFFAQYPFCYNDYSI